MEKRDISESRFCDILKKVGEVADRENIRAYVVGGFVRDFLLGNDSDDIDIVVEGSGIEFAKAVGKELGSEVSYYDSYGTASIKYRSMVIEFVGARKEMYRRGSRNPVVEEGTIQDDQLRRDFTINAMAFVINEEGFGTLVDPFNGLEDLENGVIRTPQYPDTTFRDDPLRMLRAIRFAAKLSTEDMRFYITKEVKAAIRRNAKELDIIVQDRKTAEVAKIMSCEMAFYGFRLMSETGVGRYLTAEHYDLDMVKAADAMRVITEYEGENGFKSPMLHWITLFKSSPRDERIVGKDNGLDLLYDGFNLPNAYRKYGSLMDASIDLIKVYENRSLDFMRLIVYRMEERYTEVPALYQALYGSTGEFIYTIKSIMDIYARTYIRWKCPVNGEDIKKMGIGESKELGFIKNMIVFGIMSGRIRNTREDALKSVSEMVCGEKYMKMLKNMHKYLEK